VTGTCCSRRTRESHSFDGRARWARASWVGRSVAILLGPLILVGWTISLAVAQVTHREDLTLLAGMAGAVHIAALLALIFYYLKRVRLQKARLATQWEPTSGKRLLVLLGLFFVVIVILAAVLAAVSSSSRERRSAATATATAPATQGGPLGPAPTAPVTVSVATFAAGNVVDKCDDYAITATAGVAAADQAWANRFANGVIGDKKGMARLTTSCSQFQTKPVLATCAVHISDHVTKGDSGVEIGTYEIDQVRQYYNPNTIKGRDARTTECPDMKGDWQVVDNNLDVALHLVKKAVLTVDGRRSSMDIEDCIAFLTQSPAGLKPSKGWSVSKGSGSKYVASYSFINGTLGGNLATWEVDVSTKFVRFTNENAKNLSWVPAE